MNKGMNTAVLLALIFAGLLLFGGVWRDVTREIPAEEGMTVLRKLRDLISESMEQSVTVRRDVNVEGSLNHNSSFEFNDIAPQKITIGYIPDEINITTDGKNIVANDEASDLGIEGFRGSLKIQNNRVELIGDSTSLSSKEVGIEDDKLETSVAGTYEEVNVTSVQIQELRIEDPSGTIDVGNSVSSSIDDKVSINAFYGNLSFEPQKISISGEASKVEPGNMTITSS
ncbi:MAG: hypothetical protein ACLFQ8_02285 [Candidatus Aenigmatarchaeota archaeon]